MNLHDWLSQNLNGRWEGDYLILPEGRVLLDLVSEGDTIELKNIRCEPERAGLGRKVTEAIQAYAKEAYVPIWAQEVEAPDFFEKMGFVEDEDYDPELYGHETPDRWWTPIRG